MNYDQAKSEFIKTINRMANKYSTVQVFSDFVEMAAISISNTLMFNEKREKKYLETINKYDKNEQEKFPYLLSLVVQAFECKFGDFLGEVYMGIDAGNKNTGQFFTPYHVGVLCAKCTFDKQSALRTIEEKGYIGLNEPACGGGGMVIAWLEVLKENNINFQTQSLTIAQDIDYRCAYMCYIALSLLGAPAIIAIGDTLKMEVWETLYTPFYVLNKWRFVEREGITLKDNKINELVVEKPLERITYTEDKKGQFCLF